MWSSLFFVFIAGTLFDNIIVDLYVIDRVFTHSFPCRKRYKCVRLKINKVIRCTRTRCVIVDVHREHLIWTHVRSDDSTSAARVFEITLNGIKNRKKNHLLSVRHAND